MTDVTGVETKINPHRSESQRQPVEDFSRELAKEAKKASVEADVKFDTYKAPEEYSPAAESTSNALGTEENTFYLDAGTLVLEQQLLSTVVQPIGQTQAVVGARVYGVHLLAGTYLSEVTTAGDEASTSKDESTSTPDGVMSASAGTTGDAATVISVAALATSSDNRTTANGMSVATSDGITDLQVSPNSDSAISKDSEALGLPLAFWSARSIRIISQHDGKNVAWLRDYQADERDMSELIESVLSAATHKGIALTQIILNGREVWSSRDNG